MKINDCINKIQVTLTMWLVDSLQKPFSLKNLKKFYRSYLNICANWAIVQ